MNIKDITKVIDLGDILEKFSSYEGKIMNFCNEYNVNQRSYITEEKEFEKKVSRSFML